MGRLGRRSCYQNVHGCEPFYDKGKVYQVVFAALRYNSEGCLSGYSFHQYLSPGLKPQMGEEVDLLLLRSFASSADYGVSLVDFPATGEDAFFSELKI